MAVDNGFQLLLRNVSLESMENGTAHFMYTQIQALTGNFQLVLYVQSKITHAIQPQHAIILRCNGK